MSVDTNIGIDEMFSYNYFLSFMIFIQIEAASFSKDCEYDKCPINCTLSEWSNWSRCFGECDGSTHRNRSRVIDEKEQYGGTCDESLEEKESCNRIITLRSSWFTDWTEWSSCSQTCGNGTMSRSRVSKNDSPLEENLECSENKPCILDPCPKDCIVSDLSTWTSCPGDCSGQARKYRTTRVEKEARFGGTCGYDISEEEICNISCPRDWSWVFFWSSSLGCTNYTYNSYLCL